jgi:hypothetical protein
VHHAFFFAFLAILKSYLGPAGLEELVQIFNFSLSERDKMLDDHIESAVYDAKHGAHSGLRNGSISLAGPLGMIFTLKDTLQMASPGPALPTPATAGASSNHHWLYPVSKTVRPSTRKGD